MRGATVSVVVVLALLIAGCSSSSATSPSRTPSAPKPVQIAAGTGIGKIMLGQTAREVSAVLGRGVRRGTGVRDYRQSGVTLNVTYAHGRVGEIGAGSETVLLAGTPLSRGYAYFKSRTHWQGVRCQDDHLLLHWAPRTHSETILDWGAGGILSDILIERTAKAVIGGGCGVPSPGNAD